MSTADETTRHPWDQFQQRALLIGVIALGLCALGGILGASIEPESGSFTGWLFSKKQFFQSYLLGVMCWLGVGLGSMVILMIHHLAGGNWGCATRRILEASMITIPVLMMLMLPVWLGLKEIYPWARWEHSFVEQLNEGHIKHVLEKKSHYLNDTFWLIRNAVYLVVFLGFTVLLYLRSREQESSVDPKARERLAALSAPGLIIYGVCITFASIDWVMSLDPFWYSTIYGVLFGITQVLAAHAFTVMALAMLAQGPPLKDVVNKEILRDLGNLLLAFTMLWAYMAYSQFMLIYAGNLKEETPWYIKRSSGGWQYLAIALALLHFVVPFFLLLSRRMKENPKSLAKIAGLILVMCFFDMFWWIAPSYNNVSEPYFPSAKSDPLSIHWMDIAAIVGVGGILIYFFLRGLARRPLEPIEPIAGEDNHG